MSGERIVFVDVDGVVATWAGSTMREEWEDARTVTAGGFDVVTSAQQLAAIAELPARPVWLTWWASDIPALRELLDVSGAPTRLQDAEILPWPETDGPPTLIGRCGR